MPSVKAKRLRPRNRPAGAVGRLPDAAPDEIIAHMTAAFLVRDVPALRKRVFRLGLSGSFGLDEAASREALERVQYVFWSPHMKGLTPALRDALRRDRERYVVSAGPLVGWFPGAVGGRPSARCARSGPTTSTSSSSTGSRRCRP